MSWKDALAHAIVGFADKFDDLKYGLHYTLGGPGPIKIVPYRGYGNSRRLYLKGRVLEDKHVTPAQDDDGLWTNLLNMYKRLQSDEVPHARLRARFQGIEREIEADKEGMFDVWIEPKTPLPRGETCVRAELELIEPRSKDQPEPVRAQGEIMVPPSTARFAVISDIDDTVVRTDATHLWRMARHVFLGNARTRVPFPGVAALYRALHRGVSAVGPGEGEGNPMFYVSSSPWNLYDLLVQFFRLQEIPPGPVLFLRNWGITEEEILPNRHRRHKLRIIGRMLDFYPELPFILIGDSGQEDPEIYAQLARDYPQRILAAYIRNVSRDPDRPEAIRELARGVVRSGATMILAADTLEMARHALENDWIAPHSIPDLETEKAKDEQPESALERLLGEEPAPAPVRVEPKGGTGEVEQAERKVREATTTHRAVTARRERPGSGEEDEDQGRG